MQTRSCTHAHTYYRYRHTHTHTGKQTQTERHTQIDAHTGKQTQIQTHTEQTDRQAHTPVVPSPISWSCDLLSSTMSRPIWFSTSISSRMVAPSFAVWQGGDSACGWHVVV